MTVSSSRAPRRSHARSNHARILAAAREELSRDPEASLDEIARAAGVVRRTLYGHFPSRQALVGALAEEARQSLAEALAAARCRDADPPTALARLILASWGVGDRYYMLISLGRRALGEESIRDALAPLRAEATAILERGQEDGLFADHLPAPVLALALESLALTLVETRWDDPAGEAAATAVLIGAGVPPAKARGYVRAIITDQGAPPHSPLPGCV